MATQANSVPHPILIKVDPFIPANQQKVNSIAFGSSTSGHSVKPEETFKLECVVGNNDNSDDIKDLNLTKIHYLSSPIAVEGAEPSDRLVVDIFDVTPFEKMPWGYTISARYTTGTSFELIKFPKGIFELKNGGGLFGIYATPRHTHGVCFAVIMHPGLIGIALSAELLATWNKHEGELIEAHSNAIPAVALPLEPEGAYVGQDLDLQLVATIAKEGARTIPGREHGGNCEVHLSPLLKNKTLID